MENAGVQIVIVVEIVKNGDAADAVERVLSVNGLVVTCLTTGRGHQLTCKVGESLTILDGLLNPV